MGDHKSRTQSQKPRARVSSPKAHATTASGGISNDLVLTEDAALQLLQQIDLTPSTFEKFTKNNSLMKSRKVKLAVVQHPQTPRHIVLSLLRSLFTFDLMRVALTPTISADIKIAAEESLIRRLEKLSLGEKISLGRRASGRVASALLHDIEPRVVDIALDNGRLTEAVVIRELMRQDASPYLNQAIAAHPKWSLRQEVGIALAQKQNDPMGNELAK